MDLAISPQEFHEQRANGAWWMPIDARKPADFDADTHTLPGAQRRTPDSAAAWAGTLDLGWTFVVVCAHGHAVSQTAAITLRQHGVRAFYLEGGIDAWHAAGLPLVMKRPVTRWVTRERPKIDRIACPWLIRRFIDADAQFLYVANDRVLKTAQATDATPYDVPNVDYSHVGERCSFDAFIARHALADPALDRLATIVRGADTDRLDLAPQAAGLLATSLGLSRALGDDHEMLRYGLLIYDALYAWCREAVGERHGWDPALKVG